MSKKEGGSGDFWSGNLETGGPWAELGKVRLAAALGEDDSCHGCLLTFAVCVFLTLDLSPNCSDCAPSGSTSQRAWRGPFQACFPRFYLHWLPDLSKILKTAQALPGPHEMDKALTLQRLFLRGAGLPGDEVVNPGEGMVMLAGHGNSPLKPTPDWIVVLIVVKWHITFTIEAVVKGTVILTAFTVLSIHPYPPSPSFFASCDPEAPSLLNSNSPFSTPSNPGQPPFFFLPVVLTTLRSSSKWNHTVFL